MSKKIIWCNGTRVVDVGIIDNDGISEDLEIELANGSVKDISISGDSLTVSYTADKPDKVISISLGGGSTTDIYIDDITFLDGKLVLKSTDESVDVEIDLSDFISSDELLSALNDVVTTNDLNTKLYPLLFPPQNTDQLGDVSFRRGVSTNGWDELIIEKIGGTTVGGITANFTGLTAYNQPIDPTKTIYNAEADSALTAKVGDTEGNTVVAGTFINRYPLKNANDDTQEELPLGDYMVGFEVLAFTDQSRIKIPPLVILSRLRDGTDDNRRVHSYHDLNNNWKKHMDDQYFYSNMEIRRDVIHTAHGYSIGHVLNLGTGDGLYYGAKADLEIASNKVQAIVVEVVSTSRYRVAFAGSVISMLPNTSSGNRIYLNNTIGGYTTTKPTSGKIIEIGYNLKDKTILTFIEKQSTLNNVERTMVFTNHGYIENQILNMNEADGLFYLAKADNDNANDVVKAIVKSVIDVNSFTYNIEGDIVTTLPNTDIGNIIYLDTTWGGYTTTKPTSGKIIEIGYNIPSGTMLTFREEVIPAVSSSDIVFTKHQTAHGFTINQVLNYVSGDNTFYLANAGNDNGHAFVKAILKEVIDVDNFSYSVTGDIIDMLPSTNDGDTIYLDTTWGGYITAKPRLGIEIKIGHNIGGKTIITF